MRVLAVSVTGPDGEPWDWVVRDPGTGLVLAGCGVRRRRAGEPLSELVARSTPEELRLPAAARWDSQLAPVLAALLEPALGVGCTVRVGEDCFRPGVRLDALVLRLVADGLASHPRTTSPAKSPGARRLALISSSAADSSIVRPDPSTATRRAGQARQAPGPAQPEPGTSGTVPDEQHELPVGLDAQSQGDPGRKLPAGQRQHGGPGTANAAGPGNEPKSSGESGPHRPLTAGKSRRGQGRIPGKGVRGGT